MRSQHRRRRASHQPSPRPSGRALAALTGAAVLALSVGLPASAGATENPGDKRAEVRRDKAEKAGQLDALRAEQSQIADALNALDDNLAGQQALATRAARSEQEAALAATAARQAEQDKEAEITTLETEARNVAVSLYMGRTSSGVTTFLPGQDVTGAIYRAALTELAVGGAESSIDALDTARQDLAGSRALAERTQARATRQRAAAEQQASQLQEAIALSQRKQGELDDRIDQNLAEAASLASLDAALSKEIADREAAIAARLRQSQQEAAARAAANPRLASAAPRTVSASARPAILPAEGNLVTVRGIKVDASIADSLSGLIAAAAASGFALGGNGYRSADQQIAVRRSNCGSSEYDIWQKPASQCRPPAARPGTSMHERGLAVDFTCNGALITSYSSDCYAWMKANAPGFGFHNRPGEAWHWSPNGN